MSEFAFLRGRRVLMPWLLMALALALAAYTASVRAKDAPATSADPVLEKRTMALSAELRCLVCQNQTIADSNASLAVDLRDQIRDMLRAGKTDAQVMAYMTERYGDFVLYRPPVKSTTALLWFGPPALLVLGALTLWLVLRQRSRMGADQFEPDENDETPAPSPVGGPKPAP